MTKARTYDAPFGRVLEALISGVQESGVLLVADIAVQKNAGKMGSSERGLRPA